MEVTVTMWNDTIEDEVEITFPAKLIMCERCLGEGRHTNPSIDGHGITQSEMAELGEEFFEDYMSGVYDVGCEECKGIGKVKIVDEARLGREQRMEYADYVEYLDELLYAEAEQAAERAMGA